MYHVVKSQTFNVMVSVCEGKCKTEQVCSLITKTRGKSCDRVRNYLKTGYLIVLLEALTQNG